MRCTLRQGEGENSVTSIASEFDLSTVKVVEDWVRHTRLNVCLFVLKETCFVFDTRKQ